MKKLPYLLLLPAALMFASFIGVPLLLVGQLSLLKTDYVVSRFVGLSNYTRMLQDGGFWLAVVNCLCYAAIMVPAETLGALGLSLLLFDSGKRVQDAARFVFYMPSFAGGVILAKTWRWIFAQQGIANYALSLFGVGPVAWLLNRPTGIVAVAIALTMTSTGTFLVIILGAMLSIPKDLIDAARMDGCTGWQLKRRIVVPLIAPTLLLVATLVLMGCMSMWETARFMTAGAPMGGTATMVMDIIDTGFVRSDYGMASAKGVVMIAIVLALALVKRRMERG